MSICSPCSNLKPVVSTSDLILIGVAAANTDYRLKLKRLTDNRIEYYSITSDGSGNIYLPYENSFAELPYKVNVFLESAPGVDVEFSIGESDTTATCVIFNGELGCVDEQSLIPA